MLDLKDLKTKAKAVGQTMPWLVEMRRDKIGTTTYRVASHTHPAVAVVPAQYWPEGYEPVRDDDGYCQPDSNMDASPHRAAIAIYIAHVSPQVVLELIERIERLEAAHA